jgi:hypothetical protein
MATSVKIPIPQSAMMFDPQTGRPTREWYIYWENLGAISGGLASLPQGKIWIGNAAGNPVAQTITGDISLSAAGLTTLDTVNTDVGTYGTTSKVPRVTVNGKGLVTAVTEVQVTGIPKDTYINEEYTVPLYYQLILYQTLTLIGTASIDVIGTVVLI